MSKLRLMYSTETQLIDCIKFFFKVGPYGFDQSISNVTWIDLFNNNNNGKKE